MFGLTVLGIFHTTISLVAVIAGLHAFWRWQAIDPRKTGGKIYLVTTVVSCLTGLGIFAHGGFGKPHALALITLVVLAIAVLAQTSSLFGRFSRQVEVVSYSLSFFFHLIPGITETSTRLPLGHPLLDSPEAPVLQTLFAVLFVVFLVAAVWQARRIK
ncbi:hypothetical protein ACO0LF_18900 [Undibacterium sp. Di27W]|uniref:hypothetical protein n=1 Tax=Undibacterium sp. Di27W TaxID=3413036 RepID=UPI003BF007EF